MEYENLVMNLRQSLFSPVTQLSVDISELALDSLLDDGVLKEIPIVKSCIAFTKVGQNIRDRYFTKKLVSFIVSINSGKADAETIAKRKLHLISDEKVLRKELDHIIMMIDRYVETEKAKVLSTVYLSYLDGYIDWDSFCEVSLLLERVLIGDLKELKRLYDKLKQDETSNHSKEDYPPGYGYYPKGYFEYHEIVNKPAFNRLLSLGLVNRLIPKQLGGGVFLDKKFVMRDCCINELGMRFYEYTL